LSDLRGFFFDEVVCIDLSLNIPRNLQSVMVTDLMDIDALGVWSAGKAAENHLYLLHKCQIAEVSDI